MGRSNFSGPTNVLISAGGNANKGGNATATRPVRQKKPIDRAMLGQRGKVSNTIISQPRRHSGSQPILTLRGHAYEKVAINAQFTIHHLQEVQGL